ncbi:hypothetical protein JK386_04465 [Nocardioides sp. zg-536]|uniref:Uncharacterized protein n=1 Tax=Nocardioides faecalis TaxID=2803858 RepID=A0A939BS04_9ACTN|nr:hypothetical protein [Nocardioides faecalis]MBM9459144.1 hypothetical protein [Nocardioides faecalis]MBS4751392.1 hypothetical protein [Nocardioides faecalis]QVI59714.1 hypothetical protein KG111_05050 [Nocardioides faecalis]
MRAPWRPYGVLPLSRHRAPVALSLSTDVQQVHEDREPEPLASDEAAFTEVARTR